MLTDEHKQMPLKPLSPSLSQQVKINNTLDIVQIINVHIQGTEIHICVKFQASNTNISRFIDINVTREQI